MLDRLNLIRISIIKQSKRSFMIDGWLDGLDGNRMVYGNRTIRSKSDGFGWLDGKNPM